MKQRYHYNVVTSRVDQHVKKGYKDELYISHLSSYVDTWAIIMDAGTGYSDQTYNVANQFLPKEWILEKWEEGYYITSVAGQQTNSSFVVMSKGTSFTQQSYKVADQFPFEWVKKKWKDGFWITSMACGNHNWVVVMSRNANYLMQTLELDFQYPSEGIHKRWDEGYRITSMAVNNEQACFVLSHPYKRYNPEETQETLRTSYFPTQHVKDKWSNNLYIAGIAYGRTTS